MICTLIDSHVEQVGILLCIVIFVILGPSGKNSTWPQMYVNILNATALMEHVHGVGTNETYRCTLVNFYRYGVVLCNCIITCICSPQCPYSAKLASYFNALPQLFPNIYIVAVDAREFSRCVNIIHKFYEYLYLIYVQSVHTIRCCGHTDDIPMAQ